MDQETRLRIELLHGLGWMVFYQHRRHLWRKQIDAGDLVLPEDVPRDSAFSAPGGDSPEAFAEVFRPLGSLSIDDETYDHSFNFAFTFQEATLRAHLEATERLASVDFDRLLTSYLREASVFGKSFLSYVTGREALDSLPISQSAFRAPPHFKGAIDALCRSGFCAEVEGGHRWTIALRPYMEAAYLWVGERTRDEVREAELTEIWETMPPRWKSLLTNRPRGEFDLLSLALIMSNFWYRGRWHEEPESKDRVLRGAEGLKGEHIPTAGQIVRLYSEGRLKG